MTTTLQSNSIIVKTYFATDVTAIDFADVEKTYRGKTGCACGCGGDYTDIFNEEDSANVIKHFKYINAGIKKGNAGLEFFGNGVEVSNPSYTSVTRIYFVSGVSYTQYMSGRIERRVEVIA